MQKSLMPKGVDHMPPHKTVRHTPDVQKSLMPKGVDHQTSGRYSYRLPFTVQKSLMPKGVDHPSAGDEGRLPGAVQKSLMPKGVDHTLVCHRVNFFERCKNL